MPSISTLHPAPAAAALAIKLNPDVLQVLLLAGETTYKPKLVVKDGHFVCILHCGITQLAYRAL